MNISKNNISLIEDHHEALKIWREKKFKRLDLVHIDAHIDFGFHPAKPIKRIMDEAKSIKELKKNLEYSLAYIRYERDFEKQTNIGNYIYPAMEEGIVKDFYWVVPGKAKDFKKSFKIIKGILKSLAKQDPYQTENRRQSGEGSRRPNHGLVDRTENREDGIISTRFLGIKFVICTLEKLPNLRQRVLLDIDTDFLVIDSLLNANNTAKIGKRKPWILPKDLVEKLKKKIKQPEIITIAYSVNGGYTPIKYKHLGDEIAYNFNSRRFRQRWEKAQRTAKYFNLFFSSGEKEHYRKAIKLNPSYRFVDNNYGPLLLSIRKLSKAGDEFLKILRADPKNPACLCGLGNISLEKKQYRKAKNIFFQY
jgi:hypothetical protein